MRLRVEFTTEPFDLDDIPRHAQAAREITASPAFDTVEVGPFGTTAEGPAATVLPAVSELVGRVVEAGATRVTLQVSVTGAADAGDGPGPGSRGAAHPLVSAVRPLVDAIGARLVEPDEVRGDDVVLSWEGEQVAAVRLATIPQSLERLLADLERRHGKPLRDLDRKAKQAVVRSLEGRGAFTVRHGVETVAAALGVSRFTVYNYLNRENAAKGRG